MSNRCRIGRRWPCCLLPFLASLQLAHTGTLVSEWTTCQSNLLLNPDFTWSNGSLSSWDVYPADAAMPLTQSDIGALQQDSKGFQISGAGDAADVDFFSVLQSVELATTVPDGGEHYVLAVRALFNLPSSSDSCGTRGPVCRASVSLLACSGADCSSDQILASDYRAAWMVDLEGYQYLHEAADPYEWHLLQVLAPAGTTHLHVNLEAILVDGGVEVTRMCLSKASSFDAVVWLMDRYYSHFPHAPSLDWSGAVQAVRPNVVGVDPPLSESAAIEELKPLLAETQDLHVYLRDSAGTIALPTEVSDEAQINVDASLLLTSEGALQFANAGMTMLKTATLTARREGEEDREGSYLYVLSQSLAGGSSPDWGILIEEMDSRLGAVDGMILDLRDLRGNGVGDELQTEELRAESMTALLAEEDYAYKQVRYRAGNGHDTYSEPMTVRARSHKTIFPNGNFKTYNGPVAVLLGPGCISSCEGWASMLHALARTHTPARSNIRSFGERTRGASGNPTAVALDNGLQILFSTWDVLTLGGDAVERVGIAPDYEVRWEPPSGGYEADPLLTAALEWLAYQENAYSSNSPPSTTPPPSESEAVRHRSVWCMHVWVCAACVVAQLRGW
eukprot:CAMPEP_0181291292 /NCGR_PEP_ID=MMETSP1101-20121128/1887_1 /TAXON_ID=46948 /ORGANISM="Rhodomonas abbreviata, Strain Caron Lab Isolate" /LENGTH=618 /DNA_ID=CAMNT_0023395669 /DNA_START=169 /DNA_END=2022 /DNA_ORIENTATION=+